MVVFCLCVTLICNSAEQIYKQRLNLSIPSMKMLKTFLASHFGEHRLIVDSCELRVFPPISPKRNIDGHRGQARPSTNHVVAEMRTPADRGDSGGCRSSLARTQTISGACGAAIHEPSSLSAHSSDLPSHFPLSTLPWEATHTESFCTNDGVVITAA